MNFFARFIKANHGFERIERPLVNIQDIFHIGYEFGVFFRRDAEGLGLPGLEVVFFSAS
jgi:hypothetical protein